MPDLSEILERVEGMGYRSQFHVVGTAAVYEGATHAIDGIRLVDSVSTDMGTDPGDDATVYMLETREGGRGYLVLPDGPHADPATASFVDRLLAATSP